MAQAQALSALLPQAQKPTQTLPSLQPAARTSLPISADWLSRHPTPSKALIDLSPAHWNYIAQRPAEVHLRYAPNLQQLADEWGSAFPAKFVEAQVTSLFASSASTDHTMGEAIKLFATDFAGACMAEKCTVLMLFFARYRAGVYDRSFTKFDPRRIGNAYFDEFLPAWRTEIGKYEEQREAAERARRYTERAKTAISREEYDRLPVVRVYLNPHNPPEVTRRLRDVYHLTGASVNGEINLRMRQADLDDLREEEKHGYITIREVQSLTPKSAV